MKNAVVHFEVISANSNESKKFYSELFSWEVDSNNPMNYGLISTRSDEGIQGGIGQAFPNAPSYALFYVKVGDVDQKVEQALSKGATVLLPKTQVGPKKFIAQLKDLDGVTFGLIQQD